MTIDELAVVLLELARTSNREEWIAEWRADLYEELTTLARWALGRIPKEVIRKLPRGHSQEELSRAALLFVKYACFAPSGTYYELFGMTPETLSDELLQARYRALIRLTHPDVGVKGLSGNAASLVNRAYTVLGDGSARAAYDRQLNDQDRGHRSVPHDRGHRSMPHDDDLRESVVVKGSGFVDGKRLNVVRGASMGERMLARWALINTRWPRRLPVFLGGAAGVVLLALVLFWSSLNIEDADTIVALAPEQSVEEARSAKLESAARQDERRQGGPSDGLGGVVVREELTDEASWIADRGLQQPPAPGHEPETHALVGPMIDDYASGVFHEWWGASESEHGSTSAAARNQRTVEAKNMAVAGSEVTEADDGNTVRPGKEPARALPSATTRAGASVADELSLALEQNGVAEEEQSIATRAATQNWQVDWRAAKHYLEDIALALENRSEARWLNHYLEQMNVRGSLLQPVMAIYEQHEALSAQYAAWSMMEGADLLDAETTLTLQVGEGDMRRSFVLRARFQASGDGTRLKALDLSPVE